MGEQRILISNTSAMEILYLELSVFQLYESSVSRVGRSILYIISLAARRISKGMTCQKDIGNAYASDRVSKRLSANPLMLISLAETPGSSIAASY